MTARPDVAMVTVGIDIGSSTSHLMFSRVHLQRMAQALSSRFVVVDRQVLWRSPIILTPYVDEDTIDSEALDRFVHDCYRQAGIDPADVDSGAVILTGEALRRRNAQAIAELFADESGTFVCASAGHHLETAMAAHGSGAVRMSRELGKPLLHVDIGGGTSKIALVADGEVLDTAAIAVGGRLLAFDGSGAVARIAAPARTAASARGIALSLGREPPAAELSCVVETMADALAEVLSGKAETELTQALLVTEPPDWPVRPEAISLSGGVAEYIYGRETAGYADIAPALAAAVRARLEDGRVPLPLVPAPQGIRATVIGASQFSLQVSGNTVSISDERVLPKTNIPVLYPRMDLDGDIDAERVAAAIVEAARRMDVAERRGEVALGFAWDGDPEHRRLAALATGIVRSRELVPARHHRTLDHRSGGVRRRSWNRCANGATR